MKKVQKVLALCVALVMLIVLFPSCSNNKDTSDTDLTSDDVSKNSSDEEPDESKDEQTEEITIIEAMYMDPNWRIPEFGNDPVTKQFMEKTGVRLEFSVPQGDADQVANVMLVSGDYPPLMWLGRGPTYEKYIASGALHAVDELAKEYNYPNITEEYIPENVIKYLKKSDGHLYIIPNWFSTDGFGSVGGTVNIRMDIYNDFGSPEINTMDDLYNYMVQVRDNNLEFEGLKVYPLGFTYTIDWVGYIANLWGSKICNNLAYEDENENKIKFMLRNDTVLQAIKFLNKAYREELMDPEVLTYNSTQRSEAFAQGKFAVVISDFWSLWTPNSALKQIDPDVYYEAIPAPQGTPGQKAYIGREHTVGWNGALITKNCSELEKAMKWFDYYLSPEGQILSFYGVEGETMEFKDGQPWLYPEAYESKLADWVGYGQKTGVRLLDLNQNAEYNWERWQESPERQANRRIAEDAGFDGTALYVLYIDPTTEEGILLADIQASMLNEITKIITESDPDKVESMYYELLEEYERQGLEKIEEAWTKQYYERESW